MRPLISVFAVLLLCPLLLCVPAGAQVPIPTPESILGHTVGEDFYLATYDESMAYFEALAAASDRVELRHIGKTSFGRDWHIALISAPENLAKIDRWREIAQRLAHPHGLDEDEARALAREGKAIVHIDGGLHSTEVAHAQHNIQLAYDLASETEDPEILQILDETVLLLWPSINPDGQNLVVEWYRSNLGTPYEVAPMIRLYQKYVGHDNNRDGYMLNTHESRVVTRVTRDWEPQILYNHHQTAPFPARIWIPPFAEPISQHVHPLMWRTVNLIGMAMAQALEERGQEGAIHMGTGFDNWYPGFLDHSNNFHNIASFLTETGLYRYATPHFYTVNDFPKDKQKLMSRSLYASPWEGGWWRLRDAVDYMLTASISVLDVAAKYKTDVLYNRYQAGRDVTDYHRRHPPYAYFVPQEQRDPVAAVEMLRRLAFNGVQVQHLTKAVTFEGRPYPAGTWVVRMDHPFANYVRQLFAVQEYPDLRESPDGPPDQPYDVAGWTLSYLMDVKVIEAASPLGNEVLGALGNVEAEPLAWSDATADAESFDSPLGVGFDSHPIARAIVPPAGEIEGSGNVVALDAAQNNAYRALNRIWKNGGAVSFVPGQAGTKEGDGGTAGRYVVSGLGEDDVRELALQATRTVPPPLNPPKGSASRGQALARPRIGLYRPWAPSMDEGWTRWLLERYEFDFRNLRTAEILAGDLESRYDVIVIVDTRRVSSLREGYKEGTVPPRYAGGLGRRGARAIDAFVRAGGTLVTLNKSSDWAIEDLHLPVENVVAEKKREEFFTGGSILEVIVDASHPVMTGMPERSKIFVSASPVFSVSEGFEGAVLAKYTSAGSPLVSGYLLGEEHLLGYAAALDVRHGDGHVILLGMRPQWRGQTFGTFRVLFNALLYTKELASAAPEQDGFWTPPEEEEEEQKE